MPTTSSSICSGPRSGPSITSSGCGLLATRMPKSRRPEGVLLHIIARGKIGRSPEAELTDRYLKRIAWPVKLTELPDRGGNMPAAPTSSVTVLLDERGEALSSIAFAKKLEAWRDNGKREARFLIGSADGHNEREQEMADLRFSFGAA